MSGLMRWFRRSAVAVAVYCDKCDSWVALLAADTERRGHLCVPRVDE